MRLKKSSKKVSKLFYTLDPYKKEYKRTVLLVSYLPFFLIILIVFALTIKRILSGTIPNDIAVIIVSGFISFLFIGVTILRKKSFLASVSLVFVITILGLSFLLMWGLIHPIGFLFCLLSLRLGYILLSDSLARFINILILLSITLIGGLQLYGVLEYDYQWSPYLTIFDYLVISFLLFLFSVIALINSIGIRKHQEKIRKMKLRLYRANLALQEEVVLKTKEVISSKTKLSKSLKTLQAAYELLEDSEIDRFSKINLLGHYGLLMSSVVHSMANPLMLLMSKLNGLDFKGKSEVMKCVNEIADLVRSVRSNVLIENMEDSQTVVQLLNDITGVLDWRLKKENINLVKMLSKENFVLKEHSSKFKEIVLNLLNNSIESLLDSKVRKIKLKYEVSVDKGKVVIENTGELIPPRLHRRIFEMFYSTKVSNSGVGLYLSRKYARDFFKGDVKLILSNRKRTVFEFTFSK